MLAAMEQEHERAAGAWQAEWGTHLELLGLVGSAAAWSRELLENLVVDPERMRANLDLLVASGAQGARPTDEQLDACATLVDRALAGHGAMSAVQLHFESDGHAGAPALLLGGSLGTTLAMWEPQLELGHARRLIRFDHRGHGRLAGPGRPVFDRRAGRATCSR